MKKILVYYDSMSAKGGVERVISNLFNRLSDYYEVTLLTTDNTPSAYQLDDKIHRVSIGSSRVLNMNKSRAFRIMQIIKSLVTNIRFLKKIIPNYDYIYIATHLNALEVYLCGKKARKKCIVTIHDSYYAANKVYQRIKKYVYPKMHLVISPTITDEKRYADDNCTTLYLPHLSTFKPHKNLCDEKVAINVGRLTNDKQQEILLHIWKDLRDENKLNGWKLRIVGDGELRYKLAKYIEENNLQDNVLLTGKVDDINHEYENAKLFLFTSRMEGFGMVLLEAMSFSLPCVSFDCDSGPRDLIENGKTGYLIPCFDINAFENKVDKLINNPALIDEMSKNCFEFVSMWNNERIINKWLNVFN